MPMAKVRMGLPRSLALMAHTRLESNPPDRRNPKGASASSLAWTERTSRSRIFRQAVSSSSGLNWVTVVRSMYRWKRPPSQ